MRWRGRRTSGNVRDLRGGGMPRGVVGGGIGTVIVLVIAMLFGADPRELLQTAGGEVAGGYGGAEGAPVQESAAEAELREFVGVALADTEDVWNALLDGTDTPYKEPKLALFRGGVRSGCGVASSGVGPFYCPNDASIYLDLGFFEELRKLGAPGDFALAYVIGHEVGHHVQALSGTLQSVHAREARASQREANELSVRLELQADFYAGVVAHHAARRFDALEEGDLEEALNAAARIGDDALQRAGGGEVRPETFTHGTGAQRRRWLLRGFETGDPSLGDTFSPEYDDL